MFQNGIVAEGNNGGMLVDEGLDVAVVDLLGTDNHIVEFRYVSPLPGDIALGDPGVPDLESFLQDLIKIVFVPDHKGQVVPLHKTV